MGELCKMKKVELNKRNLDILKIWWNIAYKEGDKEQYDKCEKLCNELIKIGKHRCKKLIRWNFARMNDLLYIPEHYKDINGILDKYYTKDNIVEICNDNKIVACHVYTQAFGELIEDKFEQLKQQYYEYFIYEPTAKLYKSNVSINMFRVLNEKQQEEVLKVLDKKTGRRITEPTCKVETDSVNSDNT